MLAGAPTSEKIQGLESTLLGELGADLLAEIESIRLRSGRLQGKLSGRMKDCVKLLRAIVGTFVDRLKASGDPTYARIENIELKAKVHAANRDAEERKAEYEALEAELRKARSSVRRLEDSTKKVGNAIRGPEPDRREDMGPPTGVPAGSASRGVDGRARGPPSALHSRRGATPAERLGVPAVRASVQADCAAEVSELDKQMERLARLKAGLLRSSRELAAVEDTGSDSAAHSSRRRRGRLRVVREVRLIPPVVDEDRGDPVPPPGRGR